MTSRWIAALALVFFTARAAGCSGTAEMTLTEYGEWCYNDESITGDYDTFGEALVNLERQLDVVESIDGRVPEQMQRYHNAGLSLFRITVERYKERANESFYEGAFRDDSEVRRAVNELDSARNAVPISARNIMIDTGCW